QCGERYAEVKVRPADRRVKLDGFAEVLDALFNITAFCNQLAKIAVGVCVIWKKPDRFLEISSGQIESALGGVEVAEIVARNSVIGSQFNRLESRSNRLFDSALFIVGIGEVVITGRAGPLDAIEWPMGDHPDECEQSQPSHQ